MQIILVKSKYGEIYYDASTLEIWAHVATKLLRRYYRQGNWPRPGEEPIWLGPDEETRNAIRALSEEAYAPIAEKLKHFDYERIDWDEYQMFHKKLLNALERKDLETTMATSGKPWAWVLLVEGERFGCYDEKIEITRVEGPENID
jgi:hypothetical protein